MKPQTLTAVLVTLSLLSIGSAVAQSSTALDFTLPVVGPNGLTGQSVSLSSFSGKEVFLEFMEPWCSHCQTMVSVLEQLYITYRSSVVFLSVAGPWNGATTADVAAFITHYGVSWTYLFDSSGSVFAEYGISATPTYYVVGNGESILSSFTGEQSYATLAGGLVPGSSMSQSPYTVTTTTTFNYIQFQTTMTSSQLVSLVVPPRYEYYFGFDLNSGDTESFSFSVSSWRGSDDVSLTVVSSTGTVLQDVGSVNQYSGHYTSIFPGRYYLRFDNSYSVFTTKTISLSYAVTPPILGIEEYQWSGNTITGYLRNYGTASIDTVNAQVSLSGMEIGSLGGTCSQTPLYPSEDCSFSVTVPNNAWTLGSAYVLNVDTPTTGFLLLVVAGGNSESVIPPQPNLITFETVSPETTVAAQSENPGVFSQDYFLTNAFEMTGAVAGGVLLVAAVLALSAISRVSGNEDRGLYGEKDNKRSGIRHVPLWIAAGLGILSLVMIAALIPLLTFNPSRPPYLLAGAMLFLLVASLLLLSWIAVSVLRGRSKKLRGVETDEVTVEKVSETGIQIDEIPIETPAGKKKICRHCKAEVSQDRLICPNCGMPTGYV